LIFLALRIIETLNTLAFIRLVGKVGVDKQPPAIPRDQRVDRNILCSSYKFCVRSNTALGQKFPESLSANDARSTLK